MTGTQRQSRLVEPSTLRAQRRTQDGVQGANDIGDSVSELPSNSASELPSIQALQDSARIQDQVHNRYQELEQAAQEQGTVGSLIELLMNSNKISKDAKLKWPQEHVFVGRDRRRPTYEQLNECQWMLGFLKQRQNEKNELVRENMIKYVIDLLQDAIDFSWPAAKGAHYVLVHRLGEGSANWQDLKSVNEVRERYAKSSDSRNDSGKKFETIHDKNRAQMTVPCYKYQRNACPENHDHPHKNLLLSHICQNCFNNHNTLERHQKRNCPRFQANRSKNV